MSFKLNDIIARSEKKRMEQLSSVIDVEPKTKQQVELNVVTIEQQLRSAERIAKQPKLERTSDSVPQRTHQVKTRLSDDEKRFFDQRVKLSGLSQGDFMRQILLHESVEIRSITATDAEALETLLGISSELGRIGGMIRGTVIRNKGEFGVLTPQEKGTLECQIRELNRLKADIQKAVLAVYGDH